MGEFIEKRLIERKEVFNYIREIFQQTFDNDKEEIFSTNVKKLIYKTDFNDSGVIKE